MGTEHPRDAIQGLKERFRSSDLDQSPRPSQAHRLRASVGGISQKLVERCPRARSNYRPRINDFVHDFYERPPSGSQPVVSVNDVQPTVGLNDPNWLPKVTASLIVQIPEMVDCPL